MGTVSFDFDAQAGYNSGANIADLYAPVLGTNGPSGWRLQPSDTSRAITYAFRAVAYGGASITVAVDWYSLTATTGTVTFVASLAAQNPTGSGESAEAPANATTVSANGTVGAVLNQTVRTIITIPNASADGLTADWLAYVRLYRNDAAAGDIVMHRVNVSYSDGINAPLQGPASSTVGNLATMNNTTGTLLADSGVAATAVALGAASSVAGNLPSFSNAGGKLLVDSGVSAALVNTTAGTGGANEIAVFTGTGKALAPGGTNITSVVKNTGPSVVDGNVTKFFGTSGLDVRDAGYAATAVVNLTAPLTGDVPQWNGTIWVPKLNKIVATASAVAMTGTVMTDITGLVIALPRAGTYKFSAELQYTQTTTATTLQCAMNYTGTVTSIFGNGLIVTAAGAASFLYYVQTANNTGVVTGTAPAVGVVERIQLHGGIVVSTTGSLSVRLLRTAAGTTTIKQGSILHVMEA